MAICNAHTTVVCALRRCVAPDLATARPFVRGGTPATMIGINDKIEAQFRRDRLRKVVSAVAMAVVAIPVLLALSLPPMGPSSIVYGTVSRLAAVP